MHRVGAGGARLDIRFGLGELEHEFEQPHVGVCVLFLRTGCRRSALSVTVGPLM